MYSEISSEMRGFGTVIDEDESHRTKNKQKLKVLDGVAGDNFTIVHF